MNKLDAPEMGYDADVAWVEYRPGSVSLFFAKKSRDEANVFESRLEVRYPAEHLPAPTWQASSPFVTKLKTYLESWPKKALESATPENLPARKSHSEWASFTYMSHWGTQAAIDFYALTPAAVSRYTQTRSVAGLKVIPIVRVQLTSFELLAFIERVQLVIGEIEPHLPKAHRAMLEKNSDAE